MFDEDQRLVMWNTRFASMYGFPEELLKTGTPRDALHSFLTTAGVLSDEILSSGGVSSESSYSQSSHIERFSDGRLVRVSPQVMDDGGCVITYEDVTAQHRHEARISFMAHHDLLTGLANRAFFTEKIEDAVARLRRMAEPFSVLLLDLDRFKSVNDTLGHPAGDQVLREVAQRLSGSLRETDVVARLGGDEFAIIQPGEHSPREGAAKVAARIVELISQPYEIESNLVSIGASIGIAVAPEHARQSGDILKMADLALYHAKAQGRNGYQFFEPAMLAETGKRRELEAELREAIARDQLELHFQPIIGMTNRTVSGFEALVRWRHPTRGLVSPDQFIPIAEETGIIADIGAWVLQRACTEAAQWPSELRVAVNLSPVQLARPELLDLILCALVESGLAAHRLELEITETAILGNSINYASLIRKLKNIGVSIALDDFGTGYSSLSYLTMLPFDKIKIDRSFTLNLTKRAECAAIVSAVLALARGTGAETVAEGIETQQQFDLLRAAGVTFGQGYLLGKPRAAADLWNGIEQKTANTAA
jgi:diguanylate cyclase (GGDEF)-like protein